MVNFEERRDKQILNLFNSPFF